MIFHPYGFLIGISIITSAATSAWLARRRGYSSDIIWNGLWWVLIPGLIGARMYHVLDLWNEFYSQNLLNIFYIWNGGLAIFGALLGGFFGLWLYFKLKIVNCKFQIKFLGLLSLVSFSLPLAQSIGRIGNYLNQELHGLPSSLPWAIRIGSQTYHPLFAYEAIWLLIGFLIMYLSEVSPRDPFLKLARNARKDGPQEVWIASCIRNNYFSFYLIWYGFGRFFLEFLRQSQDVWRIIILGININMAQLFSFTMFIVGIYLMSNDSNHQTS